MRIIDAYLAAVIPAFGCGAAWSEARTSTGGDSNAAANVQISAAERPTIEERMKDHDKRGEALRDDAARGDLGAVKRDAAALARLRFDGALDTDWNQKIDAMNAVAASVADSPDLGTALQGVGILAKTCGDCHSTKGGPRLMTREPGAAGSGARPTMVRHAWAATELWDGLVVPSDEAWARGALELSEPSLAPELLTPGQSPVPRVEELMETVRVLARQAEKIHATDERATLYSEMLASCAECHAWLGGGRGAR